MEIATLPDRRTDRPTEHPRCRTGRSRDRARGRFLARQGALLAVAVAVYFAVRSLTTGRAADAVAHAHGMVDLERALGLFVEREVQRLALDLPGVGSVANAVYIYGHWPVIVAVLGWLAWRRPAAFVVYRNALLISGVVGMLIVAAYPVAPPRLLDLGFVDTVTTQTQAYRVLQPPAFTNPFAAMPSFHAGWDLLVGIALVREARASLARLAGRVLPPLMVLTVVVTGNHFVLDTVVGDAIVLAALTLAGAWRPARVPPVVTLPSPSPSPPALVRAGAPEAPAA
jgi:hypothetical protein